MDRAQFDNARAQFFNELTKLHWPCSMWQSGELFIDLIEKLIRELHVHFP
jgi:hypothetical protein